MICPLPIDWLEFVEGRDDYQFALHLAACRPCQILVAELRSQSRERLRPSRLPSANEWPRWSETLLPKTEAHFGEIRWTASVLASSNRPIPRVPVLVLSDAWQEHDAYWCDVVPLSTDFEDATSLDLILRQNESDLKLRWSVLLRHQTVAATRDLDSRIGSLTQAGLEIVRQALNGEAPPSRFGTALEGYHDSRARLPEHIATVIRLLGQFYAHNLENEATTPANGVVLIEMKRLGREDVGKRSLQLAADSILRESDDSWIAESSETGRLKGRIEYRAFDDELVFVIDEVQDMVASRETAWILLWSTRLLEPVKSATFIPASDKHVLLGKDLGVLPKEITRLELRFG
jgi:hypothetical protein